VILATRNLGKAREFGRLLEPALVLEALPGRIPLPEETGSTFAANARLKAGCVAEALAWEEAVLADDSGLEVAALGGRPGVRSARFAGEQASDEENVEKLLGALGDSPEREARFVCALCLTLPDAPLRLVQRRWVEVEGVLAGEIALKARGSDGFGYDPVFKPDGWSMTLAEAPATRKDLVSHRGAACRELLKALACVDPAGERGRRGGLGL
jgi:XTP/dITP diphosphohydrolase